MTININRLTTHHLSKHFDGIKAVNDLSIGFEHGKITGVIGPNGSGKSTLINLLTGMIPQTSGELAIVVGSEEVKVKQMRARETSTFAITRTFQEVRLFEQMSVIDNILVVVTRRSWVGALFEKNKQYHHAIAEKVLQRVGIWQFKNKLAINLSYGQRKLLEIARVLAMREIGKAQTIFFDEPFAGLFPEMVKVVVSVIKELRDQGATIILVEHNMDLIRELSDSVIVMDSGELLAEGEPTHVLSKPEVIEAYLGE